MHSPNSYWQHSCTGLTRATWGQICKTEQIFLLHLKSSLKSSQKIKPSETKCWMSKPGTCGWGKNFETTNHFVSAHIWNESWYFYGGISTVHADITAFSHCNTYPQCTLLNVFRGRFHITSKLFSVQQSPLHKMSQIFNHPDLPQ